MVERKLTDLELERWLADDLSADRHTEATDADRKRLEELRVEHQAFLAQTDVDAEVRAIGRRARGQRPLHGRPALRDRPGPDRARTDLRPWSPIDLKRLSQVWRGLLANPAAFGCTQAREAGFHSSRRVRL